MTVEQAIARLQALERQADAGWPLGFDVRDIRALAVEAVQVLDAEATTPERARELVAMLQGTAVAS